MGRKGIVHPHLLLVLSLLGVMVYFLLGSTLPIKDQFLNTLFPKPESQAAVSATLRIENISDNSSSYSNSQVPKYEKLEVTFNISGTTATNLQMPFDPSPPPGIIPGEGITVNAQFSQDNFQTILTQPAFYYQDFDYQIKGQEWFYPTTSYSWKVRFSPQQSGNWHYRLLAEDSSGTATSPTYTFVVIQANPGNHGFVKVSPTDSRYFEFEDGTYFPALGYNMTWGEIDWNNPVTGNQTKFQTMNQNGIQLVRNWMSQWGIYSSQDVSWASMRNGPNDPGVRVPHINGTTYPAYGNKDVSYELERYWQPCLFNGGWHESPSGPAINAGSKYKVFIRYIIPQALPAAVNGASPRGLTVKLADWLDNPLCAQAGQGTVVTPHVSQVSPQDGSGNFQWQILEGTIDSSLTSGRNFLGRLYMVIDNINHSTPISVAGEKIWIDKIEVREDLGNNLCAAGTGTATDLSNDQCGVNIYAASSADYHQYFNQKNSYIYDKMLDLAHQNNIYLKVTGLEKNEYISNHIDYSGNQIRDNKPECDPPPDQRAPGSICPDNNWFYGNWGSPTKVYWLQQAYWRYQQARWGYSPNIHSWELLNEGDPYQGRHYAQADKMAEFMHQFANRHLAMTSFWTQFPTTPFWSNTSFPNIDYADVHQYIFRDSAQNLRVDKNSDGQTVPLYTGSDFYDSVDAVTKLSNYIGAKQPYGVNKPVMRGETGFVENGDTDNYTLLFTQDTNGVWLHNYIWAGINSGGLIESYWYDNRHINSGGRDLRPKYKDYYDFIKDIPLSNGSYIDSGASLTDSNLRVFGQKDIIGNRAHIWVQNRRHIWCAVVGGITGCPTTWDSSRLNGTVSLTGFSANTSLPIEYWSFNSAGVLTKTTTNVSTDASGNLTLNLATLPSTIVDTGIKIGDYTPPAPTPGPTSGPTSAPTTPPVIGDLNGDTRVGIADLSIFLSNWDTNNPTGDLDGSGHVGIEDLSIFLTNWTG